MEIHRQQAAYGEGPWGSRVDLSPRVVRRLGLESTELVDVPRVADVVTFKCLETIRAWSGHLCNCEGTFPWRAELV
jgi:hypothetical protein